jgi:MSHA biogenesis protein MshL
VSEVTESVRVINLGSGLGETRLPLAKSAVNETDTIVRVSDGNIVAIGGLMSVDVRDNRGGLPGVTEGGLGDLARNTDRRVTKRELVILLKPTVIQSDANWEQDLRETRGRLEQMKQ